MDELNRCPSSQLPVSVHSALLSLKSSLPHATGSAFGAGVAVANGMTVYFLQRNH